MDQLNTKVLRVQVELKNGHEGLGSGVVVAKNQVVTNCHVVSGAKNVNVISNGVKLAATAVKPDWKHDVCMLVVENLDVEPVTIRNSQELAYEQSVYTIGFPRDTTVATTALGVVKALFPMDDAVIMRATNPFQVGASGGGAFDDDGNLIGLITLKSPGSKAFHYYMATEWVTALLAQPALPVTTASAKPFWATAKAEWPHFMKVVHPYLSRDWNTLEKIAREWVKAEPETNEAWFYLAAAEYAKHNLTNADTHMHRVVSHNHQHSAAMFYLGLIAEKSGEHELRSVITH